MGTSRGSSHRRFVTAPSFKYSRPRPSPPSRALHLISILSRWTWVEVKVVIETMSTPVVPVEDVPQDHAKTTSCQGGEAYFEWLVSLVVVDNGRLKPEDSKVYLPKTSASGDRLHLSGSPSTFRANSPTTNDRGAFWFISVSFLKQREARKEILWGLQIGQSLQ